MNGVMIDKRTMWAIKTSCPDNPFACTYVFPVEGRHEGVFFPIALYRTRADARQHSYRSNGVVKVEVTVREVD